ncbi:MAG: ATP-grasp ribosomal peptide maturase [Pseudonocardiales bacterium]|nr:ATP-grasp ribosomal peptide maturase [Pseudonocardiales bacterium]
MSRVVVVVTEQVDVTADHVVLVLEERGVPVFRFDTAEFPQALTMSVRLDQNQSGILRTPAREVSFDDVGAVYWRRPSIYQLPSTLNADDAAWATREARFGVGGVLAAMPAWLNHPTCIAQAEYKPVQFAAAREAGLTLPPTLVTNDFHAVRKFAKEVGPIVYKPLSGVQYKHATGRDFIYTQRVDIENLDAESIGITACLFQRWIEKDYEVRLVVVDGRCFAARIDSSSERGRLDWRADYDSLTYTAISTPDHVRIAVVKLTSVLGLRVRCFRLHRDADRGMGIFGDKSEWPMGVG